MTREVIRYNVETNTYETVEEPDEMFPEQTLLVEPTETPTDE